MVTVVLWKWRSTGHWKEYTAGHVNALVAMVDEYLDLQCDFVLVADDASGIDPGIRILPLDCAVAAVPQVGRLHHRGAYRRLKIFASNAETVFGGRRLLQLDLDTIIIGDITPLVDRPDQFVIWKSPSRGAHGFAMNPSFILLSVGARSDIYDEYFRSPDATALAASHAGWTGTDQAIISHLAGEEVATVDDSDGIVSFRDHLKRGEVAPSEDVRIVSFMDRFDPADPDLQDRCPWIARHYPYRAERMAA